MRRLGAELWAGLIMLGVIVVIGLPVVLGAVAPVIPRGWWLVAFGATIGGLVGATWGGVGGTRSRASLAVAVVAAWVVVFTAPQGALAILLVVIAAVAVYVVAFPVVLVIIALNTVVLVGAWIRSGNTVDQAVVGAGLYVLLQVASGLSCLSVLREQRLRRELTRAHIELQAATALLGEGARTAERLRIARDLHDTVGHALTVLSLELEAARHRPDGREHVERAGAVARDLLTDVRATVSELRDRPTDLRGALGQVVDGIPGLVIDLDVAGDVEVGEAESATLVRAVQEITTNTLRHAGATRLTLKVRRDPDGTTVLEARDDGRGARELRLGHGLHGMVERFEALGGDVRLEGRDGFAVTARVPVT